MRDRCQVQFERHGHVKLRDWLPPFSLRDNAGLNAIATQQRASEISRRQRIIGQQPSFGVPAGGTPDVGYLQFFNSRHRCSAVKAIAHHPALVDAACRLLGCRRVRVYQVSVLHANGGRLLADAAQILLCRCAVSHVVRGLAAWPMNVHG